MTDAGETSRCPHCDHPIERRLPKARVAVCKQCYSALELLAGGSQVLARQQIPTDAPRVRIPLGRRGNFGHERVTCVGYVERLTTVQGQDYHSREYLLTEADGSPRWLVEEDGEWFYLAPERADHYRAGGFGGAPALKLDRANLVTTTLMLGEFHQRLAPGSQARVSTYRRGRRIDTLEVDAQGIHRFSGRSFTEGQVFSAFRLPRDAPAPRSEARAALMTWGLIFLSLLLLLQMVTAMFDGSKGLLSEPFVYHNAAADGDNVRVTAPFQLSRQGGVEVTMSAPAVDNNWASFNLALISPDQTDVREVVVDVESWRGYDSDGSWSEGGTKSRVTVGSVPAGTWQLRIEPKSPMAYLDYSVEVRKSGPRIPWLLVAMALFALPWALVLSLTKEDT